MRAVFADTVYWVAQFDPLDQWHAAAVSALGAIGPATIWTTQEVLIEVVNMLARRDPLLRSRLLQFVQALPKVPGVTVIHQTAKTYQQGLELFSQRLDKQYSLTDCISMATMRAQRISSILTSDHHFEQEGFTILMQR